MLASRLFFSLIVLASAASAKPTSSSTSATRSSSSVTTRTSTSTIRTSTSTTRTSTSTTRTTPRTSTSTTLTSSTRTASSLSSTAAPSATPTPVQRDVIVGALTYNKYVATAPCALGSPWACFSAGTHAVLSIFFAGYRETDSGPVQRSVDGAWMHVASVREAGVEILSAKYDNINAVRAIVTGSGVSPRDQAKAGGFVVDYYWYTPNRAAYRAFHSTPDLIARIRDIVTAYARQRNAIEMCVDFGDSAGIMGQGLLAAGWNGQPFKYAKGVREQHLNKCQVGQLYHGSADVVDVSL